MVNDLDEQLLWSTEVEGARAVAVGLGSYLERDPVRLEVRRPAVDVGRRRHSDSDVIEDRAPGAGGARRRTMMERQVVSAAAQIDIVGIGPPFDGVAHDL